MKVGFIGLGNVGAKLAGSILRNGFDLTVRDLDPAVTGEFSRLGAKVAGSPKELAEDCNVIITCLPSPSISASVMEDTNGVLAGLSEGNIWIEMSTTDEQEVLRLGAKVQEKGALVADCPVSGGCHRAATGNIAIFAGCDRKVFDSVFPLLAAMGRQVLHTGPLGTASILKVVTNYLATANLVSICEALVTTEAAGLDLATAYEAIKISSGNSFVHETESQVILNGSRDINFTMDLVLKDISLFQEIADRGQVPLEISPLLIDIFRDAQDRYGPREWSPNVIKRLEDATGLVIQAPGFPSEMSDEEPEAPGQEVGIAKS
ncbi:MAG TPA: 3-hydroxyisobutyrate dehydrogenase [Acidimicrobiaceae bacterium]|nr:3-hydroxyisobutyrate dehydrogenase [Acidimicrobiaceae bacterium]